jgi:predicted small lipoprotein YifL
MTVTPKHLVTLLAAAAALAACGGGGALDNPDSVANPPGTGGQKLSFAYFQRCINPVLNTPLPVNIGGVITNNTCAAAGCHDNASGTGGALRLFGSAPAVSLSLAPDAVRASDMYKNFYSSLGESVVGSPDQSRMLNKPLVRGVLHGGGLIFTSPDDPAAKLIRYWINRPMPAGQDEFSPAANTMFTPADPSTGTCNTD